MDYKVVYTKNNIIPARLNAVKGAMNATLPDLRWSNKIITLEGIVKESSDYPPVQYKILRNRLALVFVGPGLELLEACQPLLNNLNLNINGEKMELEIKDVAGYTCHHLSGLGEFRYYYNRAGWLPMNTRYFLDHKNQFPAVAPDEKIKRSIIRSAGEIQFFEDILGKHIRTVASKDGAPDMVEKIIVRIISTSICHDTVLYFDEKASGGKAPRSRLSDFSFMTNAMLSPHLGYGRGASLGFGMMTPRDNP